MNPFMSLLMALAELFITKLATVRLFASMNAFMILQLLTNPEFHGANFTRKGFFTRVNSFMYFGFLFDSEFFIAILTRIWIFICMNPFMHCEHILVAEF